MAEIDFKKLINGDPNDKPEGQIAIVDNPTICKKCIFYQQRQFNYICIAKIKKVMDFVTGKERIRGYRNCVDINTDGKCQDYKEMET